MNYRCQRYARPPGVIPADNFNMQHEIVEQGELNGKVQKVWCVYIVAAAVNFSSVFGVIYFTTYANLCFIYIYFHYFSQNTV